MKKFFRALHKLILHLQTWLSERLRFCKYYQNRVEQRKKEHKCCVSSKQDQHSTISTSSLQLSSLPTAVFFFLPIYSLNESGRRLRTDLGL